MPPHPILKYQKAQLTDSHHIFLPGKKSVSIVYSGGREMFVAQRPLSPSCHSTLRFLYVRT